MLFEIREFLLSRVLTSKNGLFRNAIFRELSKEHQAYLLQFYEKLNVVMFCEISDLYLPVAYCKFCGKVLKPVFRGFKNYNDGYFDASRKYCGVSCQMSHPEFYEIYKEKTGFKNPHENPQTWTNRKLNCQEKHGCDNHMQQPEVQELRKQLCLEKHGVETHLQLPEIIAQIQDKRSEQQFDITEKITKALAPQRKAIHAKARQTYFERTGYYNILQNPANFESSSMFNWKDYNLPSGDNVKFQGFENVAIDKLLETYDESELVFSAKLMPRIMYYNSEKDRTSIYYPDIFIPSKNLIIEVKSTYTYKADLVKNYEKCMRCQQMGLNFQFWICSDREVLEIKDVVNEYSNNLNPEDLCLFEDYQAHRDEQRK